MAQKISMTDVFRVLFMFKYVNVLIFNGSPMLRFLVSWSSPHNFIMDIYELK
jgi:hypothetical protein